LDASLGKVILNACCKGIHFAGEKIRARQGNSFVGITPHKGEILNYYTQNIRNPGVGELPRDHRGGHPYPFWWVTTVRTRAETAKDAPSNRVGE